MGERLDVGGRRISYQDVLDLDTKEVPKHIRQESRGRFDFDESGIDRYISREWHDREKEKVWKRVWQLACREEQIPEVGDHFVYEIAGFSYLLIRSAPDKIRAYPNACPHRGRQLKDFAGRCSEIRCSFHGIAWELDGRLKQIPAEWEFPHVRKEEFGLSAVSVDTWGGFVFVNPDSDAEPLEKYLGELPEHFAKWGMEDRYLEAHVSKLLRCNWKVAQEAFMECWHAAATHPQTVPYAAFGVCQVDVYENFSRFITPSEVVGPMLPWDPTTEEMLRATMDIRVDEPLPVQLEPGESARSFIVRTTREKWRAYLGDDIDEWADCELVDNFTYTVFPNIMPWGGVHKICYRFRPNGDDHRTCIMDVFYVSPFVGERPAPAQEVRLGFDDPFSGVPALGIVGKILDQDCFNMEKVQFGLETATKQTVTFAAYQEDNLKWMHQLMDRYMEAD
ncbi:aromatic ring-hydroxylating dioxygenase subunit alpha [Rhodococcus sp. CX]|uniref:aromatic ring-hydroxylating oxygenase subunit alpha n=1 Tax=Rhodococcus sp. CX TaxID=2789880 RepID=UPI0018CE0006|nr:aromatic ring-hydroxylating dioxygenase subunit alpha [Rhodococcus sp. CX]MBH0119551.1 aromatic ring-hydroxylating dioxygenase subunit alpha [Rhodococcus sp. CX]